VKSPEESFHEKEEKENKACNGYSDVNEQVQVREPYGFLSRRVNQRIGAQRLLSRRINLIDNLRRVNLDSVHLRRVLLDVLRRVFLSLRVCKERKRQQQNKNYSFNHSIILYTSISSRFSM